MASPVMLLTSPFATFYPMISAPIGPTLTKLAVAFAIIIGLPVAVYFFVSHPVHSGPGSATVVRAILRNLVSQAAQYYGTHGNYANKPFRSCQQSDTLFTADSTQQLIHYLATVRRYDVTCSGSAQAWVVAVHFSASEPPL